MATAAATDEARKHYLRVRPGWILAILRPLSHAVVVSLLVVIVTFFLGRALLGDPARALLGPEAPMEAVEQLREELGLNRPLAIQFLEFITNLMRGDIGDSILYPRTSVATILATGVATTFPLALGGMFLALCIAIPLGLLAATSRSSIVDVVIRVGAMLVVAAPIALIGLLLLLGVGLGARLAPVGGWGSGYPENFRYLWLPALTLGLALVPTIMRVTRIEAMAAMREPHIEAALSRGIPRRRIIIRHVLPNCAVPIITIVGLSMGNLLSGALVTEIVFGIPGLGRYLSGAIAGGDYPVLQGSAIIGGVVTTLSNSLAEILQAVVDPRLRS